MSLNVKDYIRTIADFPHEGILFRDVTTLFADAVVEVHDDALKPGERVLIVDDLLATGGTAAAGISLCERMAAKVVGCAFVIDLPDLGGRKVLEGMGHEVHALCAFEGT